MLQGSKTIGRLFKYRLQQSPDNYAIGWIENNEVKNLKFSEYKNTLEVLAAALKGIGVNIGDKVSLLAQTCKEWHLLDMATMLSRSCLVPIYPNYLTNEIKYIFNHSESNVLIVENDKQMEAEITAGLMVSPAEISQMEKAQMEMSLMPPEPEPEEEGMDPNDYEKGNF